MLEISEKSHTSILIGSLDKIYRKGLLGKPIVSKELYLLDIIFNLLDGCCVTLTNDQRRQLLDLYRRLYIKSEQICPGPLIKKYQMTVVPKFIQAESTDCDTYPQVDKIFYWQEESIATLIGDITPLVDDTDYLNDKLSDTFANFETGKEITYTKIGRICFLVMESDTLNYEIKDVYNNIVTDAFDIVLIPAINSTLIVSKNFFSHGDINFKIKKL